MQLNEKKKRKKQLNNYLLDRPLKNRGLFFLSNTQAVVAG